MGFMKAPPSAKVSNGITIKDITLELWKVYKDIRLKGLQEDPQAFSRSYEEELAFPDEKWKERANNPFGTMAMRNGNPIGTMSAFISEEDGKRVANIVGAFVLPEARGKGLGSLLMQRVLEKIDQSSDIDCTRLSVNKDQLAAIRLYEKFGFCIISEKAEVMGDGRKCTEYIMERNLFSTDEIIPTN